MITLFIDFDGVFHPTGSCNWDPDEHHIQTDHAFRWWPQFKKVLDDVGSPFELVIHSTWRLMWETNPELFEHMPKDMVTYVRDCTSRDHVSRYASIQAYVEDHGIEHYLIIDDERNAFPPYLENLVICSSNTGVSTERVQTELTSCLQRLCPHDNTTPSLG